MERPRFQTPRASRWPLALAATAIVAAASIGAWWWLGRSTLQADVLPQGELISADAPTASAAEQPLTVSSEAPPIIEAASSSSAAPVESGESVEMLLSQADEAFGAGDARAALAFYKDAAVRLQTQMNRADDESERQQLEDQLADVQALVRDAQEELGDSAAAPAEDFSQRIPHAPLGAGEVRELTIKELGNFPYDDRVGGLPADVQTLDGTPVRLVGYMLPAKQTDQIREFTLVSSVYECCFGTPPGVEHTINVMLPEGKAVTFTYGEVQVAGTLRVREDRRDGYVMNLFTIEDVTSVRATGRQ